MRQKSGQKNCHRGKPHADLRQDADTRFADRRTKAEVGGLLSGQASVGVGASRERELELDRRV